MNHKKQNRLMTERLLLREWRAEDAALFAELNASPQVMRHYPSTLTREESDQVYQRISQHFTDHGFGLWVVEIPGVAPFIGFVGLHHVRYQTAFTPCIEIGWRISEQHWEKGYATEAAVAAMDYGIEHYDEIVSFTAPENKASQRVMQKLGMTHDPAEDFDHPLLPKCHRLCRHVLYRMSRKQWLAKREPF